MVVFLFTRTAPGPEGLLLTRHEVPDIQELKRLIQKPDVEHLHYELPAELMRRIQDLTTFRETRQF